MNHNEAALAWEANAEAWTALSRKGYDRCRDLFNTPTFMRMLPDIAGLRGIDIGCGEGHNTRMLAEKGASMCGIDVAPTFIRYAQEAEAEYPLGIDYQIASATALPFRDAEFDFATAFMSFQDICGQEEAVSEAFRVVKQGGFFQFSITHPCFQTPKWKWVHDEEGRRSAMIVGDYFAMDGKCHVDEWIFGAAPAELKQKYPKFKVPYYKRTLSSWLNLLIRNRFTIEELAEPTPDDDTLAANPQEADARVIAYFLIIRCRKG